MFWFVLAFVTLTCMSLDDQLWRRTVVLAIAAAAVGLGAAYQSRGTRPARPPSVIDKLPRALISDAQVYGLDRTPAKFTHVRRNARILSLLEKLAPLRAYGAHSFAIACAYAEALLRQASRRACTVDVHQLVLLKNRVLDSFQELAIAAPPRTLSRLQVPDVLKALDTVLFTEAVSQHGRVQDVYPVPASEVDATHQVHGAA